MLIGYVSMKTYAYYVSKKVAVFFVQIKITPHRNIDAYQLCFYENLCLLCVKKNTT